MNTSKNMQSSITPPVHQQGAALIVSMVLIFMLSILGLTSMRSSTLENRLVGNALQKDLTIQAADSAGEISLDDEANLVQIVCSDTAVETEIEDINNNGLLQTSATVAFGGQSPAVGFSCLLYTSPSPRDQRGSRMPSSA